MRGFHLIIGMELNFNCLPDDTAPHTRKTVPFIVTVVRTLNLTQLKTAFWGKM
jgi:hypothetical protein